MFKKIVEYNTNCNIPFKSPKDIEQAVTETTTIQEAASATTTTIRQIDKQMRTILTTF